MNKDATSLEEQIQDTTTVEQVDVNIDELFGKWKNIEQNEIDSLIINISSSQTSGERWDVVNGLKLLGIPGA